MSGLRNVGLIVRYEYLRHVRRPAFLWTVLGIPLLIVFVAVILAIVALSGAREQRVGVVDEAGIVAATPVSSDDVTLEPYADEAAARAAFDARTLDAYVVVPADYIVSGDVRAVGRRALSDEAEAALSGLLETSLLEDVAAAERDRVAQPMNLVLRTVGGGREIGAGSGLLFLLPYAFAVLFVMTTFTTSGYLIQALTEEKEDRVIEILATTVRPEHMMAGKVLGLSAVGATQMLVWVGIPAIIALVVSPGVLSATSAVPWGMLALAVAYFVLGFMLIATCYAAIGAAVTSPQEGQAFVAPISLLAVAPLVLVTVILARPNGMLAVVFSLVPFSSAMTMLMRLPLADIPLWQIVGSLAILISSTLGAIWLSGRVMRLGMLRFNQRLRLDEIFRRGS